MSGCAVASRTLVCGLAFCLLSGCGDEGVEISTVPEPVVVELSASLNFIAGSLVDERVDDTNLDLWVGTFEELTTDLPGSVTFTSPNIGFDAAEVACTTSALGAECPIATNVNIARGGGFFARIEDPRGAEGNWLTTLSPLVLEPTLVALRENPTSFTAELPGVVLPRVFLEPAALALDRPTEELERVGALITFVIELDDEGIPTPVEGATASLESRREYDILYANAFGLPDPALDSTSSSGVVWVIPRTTEVQYHVIFPVVSVPDGRVAQSQGFINRSAFSVIPLVLPPVGSSSAGD